MSLVAYIRKNGIKRVIDVIYRYKIDLFFQKVISKIYKNKELLDVIVIESHNDFDCNGGPLYDYLIENGYNKKYKIVWRLKNAIPKDLPENVYAYSSYKPSFMKNYYICRAKFLSADNDVINKVRDDQISLYCTHGAVGLKDVAGLVHIPESVDYVLTPSQYYAPVLARQLGLAYPNNKMLDLGYPYHDVFYKETEDEVKKITKEEYKKIFLWMPTFRKGGGHGRNDSNVEMPFGIPLIENEGMLEQLQVKLEENNSLLIIKIHPMQDPDTYKNLLSYKNIIVLNGKTVKELGVDNYRLFKSVDAIISDYSSVAYSFLLLNRPIAFMLADVKDYKLGFAMENYEDYLVGHKIYTFDEFLSFYDDVINEKDEYAEARENLAQTLYAYRDGNSCKRIIEFMEKLW